MSAAPAAPHSIKEAIRARAQELGFQAVGFAAPDLGAAGQHLHEFLRDGRQGDMDWLVAKRERRADPKILWPEARTVVVLGMNYGPSIDPLAPSPSMPRARATTMTWSSRG
jgi:epoxyqueuosine reductase